MMERSALASPSSLSARGLAVVLAALAVILVAVDRVGGAVLDHMYRASTASPVTSIVAADAEVVVLGSSVSKYAIDPDHFLPRSYNAGANGQGLFYATAIMRNLPRGAPVRRVVLGFDPAEFNSGYKDSNFKHLTKLSPLAWEDRWLRESIALGDSWAGIKNLSHLYFYQGHVHRILKRWLRPAKTGSGFEPLNGVEHPNVHGNAPSSTPPRPTAPESMQALDALLAAAAERGIQVVGIVIPLWGRAREDEPRFATVMTEVRARLTAAGRCDLTGVSSAELERIRSDGNLFFDGPHMNAGGARDYSRELARLIEENCG